MMSDRKSLQDTETLQNTETLQDTETLQNTESLQGAETSAAPRALRNRGLCGKGCEALWGALAFALPTLAFGLMMAVCGVTPFGQSTLVSAENSEWFGSFCEFYEALLNGESLFYSFNTGFGGSFYSAFASGLCSPFMLIALLFGSERLALAYSAITLLRAGFAGWFAWLALKKTSGGSSGLCFAAACGYALCGFGCCAVYYPSIADCAVFFPLFVLGIYTFVCESRLTRLFVFGAIFFVTSPTMLICGLVMGFVFYAAFYFKRGSKKLRVYRLAMFSATLLCSAMVSAILVIPLAASAIYYKGGLFAGVETVAVSELAAALCGTDASSLCLSGMLIMGLLCYLLNRGIRLGERLSMLAGAVILLLGEMISPLGNLLFGMYPSEEAINAGFALAMLAAFCTARNFAEIRTVRPMDVGISAGVFALILALALRGELFMILVSAGLAAVFAALFVKACLDKNCSAAKMSIAIAAAMLVFGMAQAVLAVSDMSDVISDEEFVSYTSSRSSVLDDISQTELDEGNALGFFRYRSTDSSSANGVNLTENEIEGFSELVASMGIVEESESGGGENFTLLTDILFGVKYVINGNEIVVENEFAANSSASPAYVVSSTDALDISVGAFEVQNQIAESWFGVEQLFTEAEYSVESEVSSAESDRYKWTFGSEDVTVYKYTFSLDSGDTLYMLNCGEDYSFAVGSDNLSSWRQGCANGIYELAAAESEGGICVYLAFEGNPDSEREPEFRVISSEAAEELTDSAAQRSAEYISRRGNRVNFMIECEESCAIVTSIPYEYGWSVTVNGESVEPEEVAGGLIGVELNAGANSIVMEYRPPLFNVGMWISIIMAAAGLYMSVYTEHEFYRRRQVRKAFRAIRLDEGNGEYD